MSIKENYFKLLMALIVAFSIISCEKDESGACETLRLYMGNRYSCRISDDKDVCVESNSWSSDSSIFYSGKSCEDIGYTDEYSSNLYYSPLGSSHRGSETPSGSDDDDEDVTTSCNESNYTGPSAADYPQSSNYCKMAWYYQCMGKDKESTEVKTYCAYYRNFENVPTCTYCNGVPSLK